MDDLREAVDTNRAAIESLQHEAAEAHDRADAGEARADQASLRAELPRRREQTRTTNGSGDWRSAPIDAKLLAERQAEGIVSVQHAAHLEGALIASRQIAAAIGIIMALRQVNATDAFSRVVNASQNSNRKLRVLTAEIVDTGDVSQLPTAKGFRSSCRPGHADTSLDLHMPSTSLARARFALRERARLCLPHLMRHAAACRSGGPGPSRDQGCNTVHGCSRR